MRRSLPLVLSMLVAAPALAGPHLRWNAPFGHADATVDRAFACNVNTGEERLVFSFFAPDSIDQVVGFSLVADIKLQTSPTPDWWRPSCSPSRFGYVPTPDPTWAVAAPQGPVIGAIDLTPDSHFGVRLRGVSAWEAEGFSIGPATGEIFVMSVAIQHTRSVAAGATPACAGCSVPACIGFNLLEIGSLAPDGSLVTHRYEGYASLDQQFYATWQGGTSAIYPCPAAVPVTPSSWGRIKTSYR